MSYRIRELN
ncbi:hypothetical protein FG05_35216 [Fusarium graminearum]|nr:hypothetical protein FG05_35216 [Fusarium graminearum]